MKKFIIGFLLGSILFGTGVLAVSNYLYNSYEVSYIPNDTTWHVESVDKALDDLHYKVKNYMPIPTATKTITSNGADIDVKEYAKVNVNVSSDSPINNFLSKQTGYWSRTPNAKTVSLTGLTVGKKYIFFITAAAYGGSNADVYQDVGIQPITSYSGVDNVTTYKDNVLIGTATSTTLTVTFQPKKGSSNAWDTWSGVHETNHIIALELE